MAQVLSRPASLRARACNEGSREASARGNRPWKAASNDVACADRSASAWSALVWTMALGSSKALSTAAITGGAHADDGRGLLNEAQKVLRRATDGQPGRCVSG